MSDGSHAPRFATASVPPSLASSVESFWDVDACAGWPGSEPLATVAHERVVLSVTYRGRLAMEDGAGAEPLTSALTGVQRRARRYRAFGPVGTMIVRFRPFGAYRLLGVALDEVEDRRVPLRALLPPSEVARLEDALASAHGADARRDALVAFLERRRIVREPTAEVEAALAALRATAPPSIAHLAASLGFGERRLERRFAIEVGTTPKTFAGIARFQRAIARLGRGGTPAGVAALEGYADQSHLIRAVRRFAGLTPGALARRSRSALADAFHPRVSDSFDTIYL